MCLVNADFVRFGDKCARISAHQLVATSDPLVATSGPLVATNWRAEILASLSPDLTKSALTRHMIYATMINPCVDQSI